MKKIIIVLMLGLVSYSALAEEIGQVTKVDFTNLRCIILFLCSFLIGPLLLLHIYFSRKNKELNIYLSIILIILFTFFAYVLDSSVVSFLPVAFFILSFALVFIIFYIVAFAFIFSFFLFSSFVVIFAFAFIINNLSLLIIMTVVYILSTVITYLIMRPKFKKLALEEAKKLEKAKKKEK